MNRGWDVAGPVWPVVRECALVAHWTRSSELQVKVDQGLKKMSRGRCWERGRDGDVEGKRVR
jgi:hypothetical protein